MIDDFEYIYKYYSFPVYRAYIGNTAILKMHSNNYPCWYHPAWFEEKGVLNRDHYKSLYEFFIKTFPYIGKWSKVNITPY